MAQAVASGRSPAPSLIRKPPLAATLIFILSIIADVMGIAEIFKHIQNVFIIISNFFQILQELCG
jgi:hypothetical protein